MKFVLVGEREYRQYFTCLRRNSNNQLTGNLNDAKKRKRFPGQKQPTVKKQQKLEAKKKIPEHILCKLYKRYFNYTLFRSVNFLYYHLRKQMTNKLLKVK